MLAVSTTWEAQLWAFVNASLEASIDSALDARAGWWSQEAAVTFPDARETGAVKLAELTIPDALAGLKRAEGKQASGATARELRDVFSVLAQTPAHGVQ